jgi:3-methyladenine DNA glycosylase AlkD
MDYETIIAELKSQANPDGVAGMARFGINPAGTLGVSMPTIRQIARKARRDHALALRLWASGIHEARILAALVDDPKQVTPEQMDRWVADFDSWDVCDQVCGNLFDRTPYAYDKAAEWAVRPEEFVRRAGFALMTQLAVHDKKADDVRFEAFYPLIRQCADDQRNFVKKAVNWAIRGIGKRSRALNASAIALAEEIRQMDSKAARWVAADALRELTSDKTQARIKR